MHIVFQKQNIAALEKSFELEESLKSEIFCVHDDFSVGPLKFKDPVGEVQLRKNWWQEVWKEEISLSDPLGINNQLLIHNIRKIMDADHQEHIILWVAPNVRDVCGYYRVLWELEAFSGRVQVIHLNNLPFINEKGSLFYPEYLFEIPAREFVKARKLARQVTEAEFELDTEEWGALCRQDMMVRKLQGAKKLSSHEEDTFDKDILAVLTNDYLRASKVVNQFLSKSKEQISQYFILWRLYSLIEAGTLETKGEVKNAKDFEVKKRTNESVEHQP